MKRNLDQDTKRSPANPIELEPRSSTVDGRGSDAIIDVMSFLSSSQSVIRVLCGLADDAVMFLRSSFHSRTALIAENLFLRKQLTFYQERRVRPRRLTNAARHSLVFWSRFFEWKSALLIVKPATLIGWHREAFRLFWKWKSRRVGRPRLPVALQQMIARMVHDNPTWGEERIADELWLKLGFESVTQLVRPGGVLAFQEPTWIPMLAMAARLLLWSRLLAVIHEIFLQSGVNPEMGIHLYRDFQEIRLLAQRRWYASGWFVPGKSDAFPRTGHRPGLGDDCGWHRRTHGTGAPALQERKNL
jgi:hypothetical protein